MEHVGLLADGDSAELNETRNSIEKETLRWAGTPKSSRRQWLTYFVFGFLIFSALVLLFSPQSSHHANDLASTITARLRSEADYILDSQWDFNAEPTTREHTWIISEHTLNPDGVFRPMILINATFPGPLIECNEGDEIVVHVHNHATNATSIHWHGLFQNGTNHMDGTTGVTQCPIAPGHAFTYRFNVTAQTGTYYYHSHVSMQASDGLVGPLIIHPRGNKAKELQKMAYQQDRVVMLSDHYYDLSSELLWKYLAPGNENDEPVPPSALINGRNIRNCTDLPNRKCDADGLAQALFPLSWTEKTRLRILNVGAFAEFSLQIDEHEIHVTEVDGTDVLPQAIHRLNINPAQRYSIIVSRPQNSEKDAFWMRARMVTHCFAYEEPERKEEVWGVVQYTNETGNQQHTQGRTVPDSLDWPEIIEVECRDLNTSSLEPSLPVPAPETADHTLYLRSSFQIRDWRLSRGYLNDSSFRINASSPILHTLLSESPSTQFDLPRNGINNISFDLTQQLVYQTTGTPTIDIIIQNFDDGTHPFHLHGYKFWILAQGTGYPPPRLPDKLYIRNRLRRDTVSVEAYGWVWIRFVADNPGVWAFHCHIGWHVEAGLGMVFGMGPGDEIWKGIWD
ncbi:multicopper oxidase-domain-containing protein [Paraphoma chrysanthemicola]|nr:multicopper oxidase-domain-containing protein [Paraphoma chrysanthemicola]